MKKNFAIKDARKLKKVHKSLLSNLEKLDDVNKKNQRNLAVAIHNYSIREAMNVLRNTSVVELSKKKKRLRTKLLIDHGMPSLLDIYTADTDDIADIKGISEATAREIKEIVNNQLFTIAKKVNIKINADDRNDFSTEIVKALSVYKNTYKLITECQQLYDNNNESIKSLLKHMRPATIGLSWLFSSQERKEKAISARQILLEKLNSEYFIHSKQNIEKINNYLRTDSTTAWNDFLKDPIGFNTLLESANFERVCSGRTTPDISEELDKEIQAEVINTTGLNCTLRRYQEWGVKYILHQKRVLLGDEMGLGKTIQAIAVMVSLRNEGKTHFMVVSPASVLINWCREIEKHSDLSVVKIHGSNKEAITKLWEQNGGVAVTTYESVKTIKVNDSIKLSILVADEAHYIKNPSAQRTVNTKRMCAQAERVLLMTGTALENKVDEMIELISIAQPELAAPLKQVASTDVADIFKKQIAPVYCRRKREDVMMELPQLIENREWCEMTAEEESVYEKAVMGRDFTNIRRVSWNVSDLSFSSKAKRLREIIEQAKDEERKILVFSFFLDTIQKVCELVGDNCLQPITGGLSPQRRQEIIDKFNNSPAGTVLVAQIIAGGTGLNIQAASIVVICEPQFKPSTENQAISRAYRMGQTRNVLVYHLLCENTADEGLIKIIDMKQATFDTFADESIAVQNSIEIDEKSFINIVHNEASRIKKKHGNENIENNDSVTDNSNEFKLQMSLSYDALVEHLLKKYGAAEGDYFCTSSCFSPNKKITRTREGLYCHHIDEDKALRLSEKEYALKYPFDYQKAERLVYCNLLEHLLLHIKIAEKNKDIEMPNGQELGIGGAVYICWDINSCYYRSIPEWKNAIRSKIINDTNNYIDILKYFLRITQSDSRYNRIVTKETIARDFRGNIVIEIFERI